MTQTKNILFIMCDQLRWDYLSCYGHPHLHTPHIDQLAASGVRFDRAYVQSPICGPSRMSTYSGRYMSTHGAYWNPDSLKVGEMGIGDYLRPLGMRTAIVGKTHIIPDCAGMARMGLDTASELGVLRNQAGFEPYERDDGLHPDKRVDPNLRYNQYLRAKGYSGHNPWHENANSGIDENGNVVTGWSLRNSIFPANIKEEDSETPYMTDRAIAFMEEAGDEPWCLHLSYIKPHWPYIVPAPYHNMYSQEDILPVRQSAGERQDPHPVYEAFMKLRHSLTFSRAEVREAVIPAYMGLIKQIDDQIGRLLTYLSENNLLENTMIVFTSDHGDYLGDHWLGEKDLFHEESVRVPLIIVDPSLTADSTRGSVETRLVEAIDLLPTFVKFAGGEGQPHLLEGRSLMPLLHGDENISWRDYVISESDYTGRDVMGLLQLEPEDCRAYMVRSERWKYIFHEKFRPQLYDLQTDANEFFDLGADPAYAHICDDFREVLFRWFRHRKMRTTVTREQIVASSGMVVEEAEGIYIGRW